MSQQQKLRKELNDLQSQIVNTLQKLDVQNKRIKFLKADNEDLRQRYQDNSVNSEQIHQQNTSLKRRNRELKAKLNEIKKMLQVTRNPSGPQTTTIRDLVINHKTEQIDLPKAEVTDQDLQSLKHFPSIRTLILPQNHITSIGASTICQHLPSLRKLFINNNSITHQGLLHLPKLTQLRCLDLRVNSIGDAGMSYICQLPQLTQLSISNNNITDAGLACINKLTNLRYLDVTSNGISDVGAECIEQLVELSNLYLSHNEVGYGAGLRLAKMQAMRVLDLRFNKISKEERGKIREAVAVDLQLFL